MFGFLRPKPLTHTQRVTIAEALAVPSQAIGKLRQDRSNLTEERLIGYVAARSPEKAQSISSRLQEARGLS